MIGGPDFRKHSLGKRPCSNAFRIEPGEVGDGLHAPTHRADRIRGSVQLVDAITKEIAHFVAGLPDHALWVDRQPPFAVGAQHIAVVEIAVEHDGLGCAVAQLDEQSLADVE